MATIYDVCDKAGVSMATVSRVINGNENVRKNTRQKVLDAMKSLGYKPNIIAQSLASKRTNSIGIHVSELSGPFYGPMMAGVEDELRKAGKHVFITSGHDDEKREKESIDFLISRNCDALILHVGAVSDKYLLDLYQGEIPIVLLNRYIPAMAEQCIILDNIHGGYIATKMLLEYGHRDIAYISGPLWKTDSQERLLGHKKALTEFDVSFDEDLFYEGDFHEQSGMKGLKYFLNSGKTFTGLACANDDMASGVLVKARETNIRIPENISVIGYDDINLAYYLHPKLTTVKYPIEEMARMAAKWILKNIYKKKIDRIVNTFLPELVVRDTCKKLN